MKGCYICGKITDDLFWNKYTDWTENHLDYLECSECLKMSEDKHKKILLARTENWERTK